MKPLHPSKRKGWPYPMNYYPPFGPPKHIVTPKNLSLDCGTNALRFAEQGMDFRTLLLGVLRRGEMWRD